MLVPGSEEKFSSFLIILQIHIMPQLGTILLLTILQVDLLLIHSVQVKILVKTALKLELIQGLQALISCSSLAWSTRMIICHLRCNLRRLYPMLIRRRDLLSLQRPQ
jgi:hypothetical protein